MKAPLFIALRIFFTPEGKERISSAGVKISVVGIAVGMVVMILSLSVVFGFKQEVRDKVVGFGSHIQITDFNSNNTYENDPIIADSSFLSKVSTIQNVRHIQTFSTKPALIKTKDQFQGVVIKGIGTDFDWNFFQKNLIEGEVLSFSDTTASNKILISKTLSDLLHLQTGDDFLCYFMGENIRLRKLYVAGIYSTGFSDYDNLFLLADGQLLAKINNWTHQQVSGVELLLKDYSQLEQTQFQIYDLTQKINIETGSRYYPQTIEQLNPQIFGWLSLLDMNVWIVVILMTLIAGFTMIAGLLIIILQQTPLIGILKAQGANNRTIRTIFIYLGCFLIGKGMLWGNIIGLSICWLQHHYGIIPLDPSVYYVNAVPIRLDLLSILLLNVGTLLITWLMLFLPSNMIAKISPAQSIRYE